MNQFVYRRPNEAKKEKDNKTWWTSYHTVGALNVSGMLELEYFQVSFKRSLYQKTKFDANELGLSAGQPEAQIREHIKWLKRKS